MLLQNHANQGWLEKQLRKKITTGRSVYNHHFHPQIPEVQHFRCEPPIRETLCLDTCEALCLWSPEN